MKQSLYSYIAIKYVKVQDRRAVFIKNCSQYYTSGIKKIVPRIVNYTPGRGKTVPRNVIFTLLVGEKLCRVM